MRWKKILYNAHVQKKIDANNIGVRKIRYFHYLELTRSAWVCVCLCVCIHVG